MKVLKKLYKNTMLAAFAVGSAMLTSCSEDTSAKDNETAPDSSPVMVQIEGQDACTLSDPITHKNLSVYLIRGEGKGESMKVCTLAEAMEAKTVVVKETGTVNQLTIENKSKDTYVFIHSGDIVKGGKQDRTLANSIVIPPNTKPVAVQSFCVEQSRWAKRGAEDVGQFSCNTKALSSRELKMAARSFKNQGEVWRQVASTQTKLSGNVYKGDPGNRVNSGVSATSLQLALENKDLEKMTKEYIEAITKQMPKGDDIIGYAFAVNGEFNSADVYLSHELFEKVWATRLDSMASEAIAELDDKKEFTTLDAKAVSVEMASNEKEKMSEEKLAVGNRMQVKENDALVSFGACYSVHEAKEPVVFHYNSISKKGLQKAPQPQKGQMIQEYNQNSIRYNRLPNLNSANLPQQQTQGEAEGE